MPAFCGVSSRNRLGLHALGLYQNSIWANPSIGRSALRIRVAFSCSRRYLPRPEQLRHCRPSDSVEDRYTEVCFFKLPSEGSVIQAAGQLLDPAHREVAPCSLNSQGSSINGPLPVPLA